MNPDPEHGVPSRPGRLSVAKETGQRGLEPDSKLKQFQFPVYATAPYCTHAKQYKNATEPISLKL